MSSLKDLLREELERVNGGKIYEGHVEPKKKAIATALETYLEKAPAVLLTAVNRTLKDLNPEHFVTHEHYFNPNQYTNSMNQFLSRSETIKSTTVREAVEETVERELGRRGIVAEIEIGLINSKKCNGKTRMLYSNEKRFRKLMKDITKMGLSMKGNADLKDIS